MIIKGNYGIHLPQKQHPGSENATLRIYHQRGRRTFDQPFGAGLDRRPDEPHGTGSAYQRRDAARMPGAQDSP